MKNTDFRMEKRYVLAYYNPHTNEKIINPNIITMDIDRFKQALVGQGCTIIGQWDKEDWLGWGKPITDRFIP